VVNDTITTHFYFIAKNGFGVPDRMTMYLKFDNMIIRNCT